MTLISPLASAIRRAEAQKPVTLVTILEAIRPAPEEVSVSLGDILSRIGQRSIAASLLVLALLMVSPLSAIPFLPSLVAVVIVMIAGQAVIGREHLWLPRFMTNRQISASKLRRAIDSLARPARWIDNHRSGRWLVLTQQPIAAVAYIVVIMVALTWPPLSFVPFSTTLSAVGMAMLAAGQTLKDGVFVMIGYAYLGLLVTIVTVVLMGIF